MTGPLEWFTSRQIWDGVLEMARRQDEEEIDVKRLFASGLLLAVLMMGLSTSFAAAQDATPVAADEPAATPVAAIPVTLGAWVVGDEASPLAVQCTAPAASTDETADQLTALDPRPEPALTDNGLIAIPAVGPADQTAINGVLTTLTQFWACNNAGNRPALVSVFTPQGIADLYGFDLELGDAELRALVAAALTPGEPRPAEEVSGVDGITSVVLLEDGRVAALVVNTDPRIAGGDQVTDLIILTEVDGEYMIDEFIGDPFDQTPGYGHEKA